ncbi:hypothetical protein SAMN06265338_101238 [Rhodoblastus acidophilus]|uniref:Uncharacterized protein n=1 Tax=Rhodoblastus acidophilus TaxID=1074 RepID=A0A212PZH9_RHOAC|nr:pyridoxamine 5'-phosphate oxidase family protein [Rhodoblastus acidophilus]PPQ38681.1 hypothetical protein CKO16_08675 [Rhodoblastus acidophilus]RAI17822.1 hypothetical protein CH337_15570 [Rhodoblastus acidophilus]SNB52364.1 hypothetical protein SAMN06265338_101238 [Rhodoblastus acidophilus]
MAAPSERRPWAPGEIRARQLAGAPAIPPVIRTFLTDQLRDFFAHLPLAFVAGLDAHGRPAASLLRGAPGFITAPEPSRLEIAAAFPDGESIVRASGAPFGVIGVDFAARRRNRVNGRIVGATSDSLTLAVEEAFGNCPKYIAPREAPATNGPGAWSDLPALDAAARKTIAGGVRFFVASSGSGGVDISHRGGPPGFVEIAPEGTLRIPDYPGNNYFNTLGNLLEHPEAALLFPDAPDGGALRLSGRARVDLAARSWSFEPERTQRLIRAAA